MAKKKARKKAKAVRKPKADEIQAALATVETAVGSRLVGKRTKKKLSE